MVCTICGQIVQILIQLTVAGCSLLDPQHYQQLIHALVPCLEGHISYSKSVMVESRGGKSQEVAIAFHRNTSTALCEMLMMEFSGIAHVYLS